MTTAPGDITITLSGHELVLMPERAVYWPAKEWLLVADTHWGKCQAFRDAGSGLPVGPLQADLDRLRTAAMRVGAGRVVVLGDLVHGRSSLAEGIDVLIQHWRATLQCELALVPGNHDRVVTKPREVELLERWGVELLPPQVDIDGLRVSHEPPIVTSGLTLCGHVHPAVRMRGRGESMKLPCFWHDAEYGALVLPAFSRLADGAVVRVSAGDARWAVTGCGVLRV